MDTQVGVIRNAGYNSKNTIPLKTVQCYQLLLYNEQNNSVQLMLHSAVDLSERELS
jgi:hypothetical protein